MDMDKPKAIKWQIGRQYGPAGLMVPGQIIKTEHLDPAVVADWIRTGWAVAVQPETEKQIKAPAGKGGNRP
jgi:hypothetical protein